MSSNSTVLRVTVPVSLQDRRGYWAARLEGLAVTAYGDSPAAALAASEEMFDFIVQTFQDNHSLDDFRDYLDKHRVGYTISYGAKDEQSVAREIVFA